MAHVKSSLLELRNLHSFIIAAGTSDASCTFHCCCSFLVALCSFHDSGINFSKRVLWLAALGAYRLGIQPMHSLERESTVQLLSGGHVVC